MLNKVFTYKAFHHLGQKSAKRLPQVLLAASMLLVALLLPSTAYAAAGGVMGVVYHAVNVVIFSAIILWLTRKPLGNFFRRLANEEKSAYDKVVELAEKSKAAVHEQKDNLIELSNKHEQLRNDLLAEMSNYESMLEENLKTEIARLEKQARTQKERDELQAIDKFKAELLAQAIQRAVEQIKTKVDTKMDGQIINRLVGKLDMESYAPHR